MTIGSRFDDWPRSGATLEEYARCSPNLRQLLVRIRTLWPATSSLGCYGIRTVRGGTTQSGHSYGAALDVSYSALGRPRVDQDVIPWLIAWSDELHLQAVHDYQRSRIWRAGRTPVEAEACDRWWRAQRPDAHGMGSAWATWLHLETTREGWADSTPVEARGVT